MLIISVEYAEQPRSVCLIKQDPVDTLIATIALQASWKSIVKKMKDSLVRNVDTKESLV